jgi:phosphate:Na+ symporter
MLVGLVNSGIMNLHQTIGVIMGTNIGTTVTAWILSLTGLTGSSFIIKILNPSNFSHIFAVIGIVFIMFSKRIKRKSAGEILLGFAVLMAGMAVMRSSVSGLEHSETFRGIMTAYSNPLLGIMLGAVFTAVIQSSSASVGILQMLSLSVGISYATAIPIIMGQNIGTCITALLSSIGTNKNARRVAIVHIYFNIIGTIVLLAIIYLLNSLVSSTFLSSNVTPASIAIIHTSFNVATTFILFPFAKLLEKLARKTIKDAPGEKQKYAFLDARLQATPTIAIAQCSNMVVEMGRIARTTFLLALDMVLVFNEKTAVLIRENEQLLDEYEDNLNTFLVKLSTHELSNKDGWQVADILHNIGDLERMGDHALNILESAEEIRDKEIVFSDNAKSDLNVAHAALAEIVNMTIDALEHSNSTLARQVEPLEEVIDKLTAKMRSRHIARLQSGECDIVPGFVWSDLLVNYERVSDHCSNIALSIIQTGGENMDRHGYLSETRTPENIELITAYNAYKTKYYLP